MNQYLFRRTRRLRGIERFLSVRVEAVLFRTRKVDDLMEVELDGVDCTAGCECR
jgi:hypothetical protein